MNIDLDRETESLMRREIAAGRFSDAASLVSVSLKSFLIARDFGEQEARKIAVLRAELDLADEEVARGECAEFDEHTLQDLPKGVHERGVRRLNRLSAKCK